MNCCGDFSGLSPLFPLSTKKIATKERRHKETPRGLLYSREEREGPRRKKLGVLVCSLLVAKIFMVSGRRRAVMMNCQRTLTDYRRILIPYQRTLMDYRRTFVPYRRTLKCEGKQYVIIRAISHTWTKKLSVFVRGLRRRKSF